MNPYQPSKFIKPPDFENEKIYKRPRDGKIFQEDEMPNLKSEALVEKIEYPPEGGMFSYLKYYKYPYKGHAAIELVRTIAIFKGLIPIAGTFLKGIIKNPFRVKRTIGETIVEILEYAGDIFLSFVPENPKLYTAAVKEFYRVFSIYGEMKPNKWLKERDAYYIQLVRDIFCPCLESDNAYRFRVQDAFREINLEEMKKHPIRELRRIFKILQNRELFVPNKNNWRNLSMMLTIFMIFSPKWKRIIGKILGELNPREIGMDKNDKYWSNIIQHYNFGYRGTKVN